MKYPPQAAVLNARIMKPLDKIARRSGYRGPDAAFSAAAENVTVLRQGLGINIKCNRKVMIFSPGETRERERAVSFEHRIKHLETQKYTNNCRTATRSVVFARAH